MRATTFKGKFSFFLGSECEPAWPRSIEFNDQDQLFCFVSVEAGDDQEDCRELALRISNIMERAGLNLVIIHPNVHLTPFPEQDMRIVDRLLQCVSNILQDSHKVMLFHKNQTEKIFIRGWIVDGVATSRHSITKSGLRAILSSMLKSFSARSILSLVQELRTR